MPWTSPADGRITSPFGPRVLAGAISNHHSGVDLGAKRGPVRCANDGLVRAIFQTAKGAWVVDVRHGVEDGTEIRTRYIHMFREEILVLPGQTVAAGQQIGRSGASGTQAAHLHFEVMVAGTLVDPVPFLGARGVELGAAGGAQPAAPVVVVAAVVVPPADEDVTEEDDMTERALQAAYREGTGRSPSDTELDPRLLRIATGASTLKDEITSILTSPEALRHGVVLLYHELLRREPTEAEVDFWLTEKDGDLVAIRAGIRESPEFLALGPG